MIVAGISRKAMTFVSSMEVSRESMTARWTCGLRTGLPAGFSRIRVRTALI